MGKALCILIYIMCVSFVPFAQSRDCYLKSGGELCSQQCCGRDKNNLLCLPDCDGVPCSSGSDCDEGCCYGSVINWPNDGNCSTCVTPGTIGTRRPNPVRGSSSVFIFLGSVLIVVIITIIYYRWRRGYLPAVVVAERRPELAIGMVVLHRETRIAAQPLPQQAPASNPPPFSHPALPPYNQSALPYPPAAGPATTNYGYQPQATMPQNMPPPPYTQ